MSTNLSPTFLYYFLFGLSLLVISSNSLFVCFFVKSYHNSKDQIH